MNVPSLVVVLLVYCLDKYSRLDLDLEPSRVTRPSWALTSYSTYCFLHSGVMWAERCSENFIIADAS